MAAKENRTYFNVDKECQSGMYVQRTIDGAVSCAASLHRATKKLGLQNC